MHTHTIRFIMNYLVILDPKFIINQVFYVCWQKYADKKGGRDEKNNRNL